jgi:hypothetical protein
VKINSFFFEFEEGDLSLEPLPLFKYEREDGGAI